MAPNPLRFRLVVAAALVLLAFGIYGQTASHGFVFDDDQYVSGNPVVLRGLSGDGVEWAFTTTFTGNRHPVAWLYHMACATLLGAEPGGHHLANAALHAANSVLLFLLLEGMTGAAWRSALVAALFCVHPLQVEAVAWVSQGRELLAALFSLLATAAWLRYVRRPGAARYGPVLLLFALALMSKPTAVTLPFVLLLLDGWPLSRFGGAAGMRPLALVLEKVPLLLLSAVASASTLVEQARGNALQSLAAFPPAERLANGLVSYAAYLGKAFLPASLAVFYPHPSSFGASVPAGKAAAAGALLALVTALAVRERGRRPFVTAGWLFFLGTLVPVIGIVQAGQFSMADRYMYLPSIGIFLPAAWLLHEFALGGVRRRAAAATAAALAVALLAGAAWRQAGYWRDGISLYARAAAVTERNWMALTNLGHEYARRGRVAEAEASLWESVRARNDYWLTWKNLGAIYRDTGRTDAQIECLSAAATLNRVDFDIVNDLALALLQRGRYGEAAGRFREALRLRPGDRVTEGFLRLAEEGARRGEAPR